MTDKMIENQEKGKGKVSCDNDQSMADSEPKQSDGSATILPIKKRWVAGQHDSEPQASTGASSNNDEESKVEDNQSEGNNSGSKVLLKELKSSDVNQENPKLYLNLKEARFLSRSRKISDNPEFSFSKNLLIFDGDDRRYEMVLSQYGKEGDIGYSVSGDWKNFVQVHNLKAGDALSFFRISDKNVSDDYYYILKYFRKPAAPTAYVPKGKTESVDRQKVYKGGYKMEDKSKESKPTESKADKIPEENTSVSSDKLKESQVEKYAPRKLSWPSSRVLSDKEFRLSKTLTSFEVVPDNAMLYLDANQASILTDSPEYLDWSLGLPLKKLLVFDKEDALYDMMLSPSITGDERGYSLSEGWEFYLRTHNLRAGDEITFYKIFDSVVSDDGQYYILTYSRKSQDSDDSAPSEMITSDAGQEDLKLEDKKEFQQTLTANKDEKKPDRTAIIVPGPGSRAMTPQDYVLTKTLGSHEVLQENPSLFLNAPDAGMLTDITTFERCCPGSFMKNLVVFDGDDERYNMVLASYVSGGLIGFSITGDWKRFVSTHNLEAGDEITFYRILDGAVSDDYYYVVRCLKKRRERKVNVIVTPGTSIKKPSDDSKQNSKHKGELKTVRWSI